MAGIIFFLTSTVVLILLLKALTRWAENEPARDFYNNYNKTPNLPPPPPTIKSYNEYVEPLVPTRPPRAYFFGRVEGEYVEKLGNYEEKYVPYHKLWKWKLQKERKEAIKDGLVNEKPKKSFASRLNNTKSDENDFFDNFWGQNGPK